MSESETEVKEENGQNTLQLRVLALRQKALQLVNNPTYKKAQKLVWVVCIIWAACIVAQSIPYYLYIGEGKQAALMGRFGQAEEMFTLALNESGNDDPSDPRLANSLNNLGELYRKQGRFEKAAPIYARLAEIVEKLDKKKQEQALGLNSVAAFYRDKGDFPKAEELLNRSLSIWKTDVKKLKDSNYAALLGSLGRVYKEGGRYKEAEALYKEAVAIREAAQGPNHADLASALLNLSSVYRKEGRYAEAEPLLKRVLQIDQSALGRQHPDFASDEAGMAGLMREMKRYAEAEPLYLDALSTRKLVLGNENPQTAKSLLGLGELRREQGKFDEAEKLISEALRLDKIVYGSDKHPDCADCLNALSLVYLSQNKLSDARAAIQRCLEIRKDRLPSTHPDLAEAVANQVKIESRAKQVARAI